jgi:hypothetical protein
MEREFIPYVLAMKLKELGFDEPCFGFYQLEYGEIRPIMVDDDEQYRLTGYRTCKNSEIPKHYTSAPTFSQVFRWFRENHNLRGFIGFRPNIKKFDCHVYDMSLSGKEYTEQRTMEEFNKDPKVGTYEEAELACLEKLIEIVENKSE